MTLCKPTRFRTANAFLIVLFTDGEISSDTVLMLTNALYFKAAWDFSFDPLEEDGDATFTLEDGRRVRANMMTRTSASFHVTKNFTFEIVPNIQFKAVSIPYQYEGGRFEMIIVLPSDNPQGLNYMGTSLNRLREAEIHENIFDEICNQVDQSKAATTFRQEINLVMPQFTVKSDVDVVKNLQNVINSTPFFACTRLDARHITHAASQSCLVGHHGSPFVFATPCLVLLFQMGVKAAFGVGEFDKMSRSEDLRVTSVKHKAMVEVNKEGTVGVAATSVEVAPLFGNFDLPPVFRVDKPFLFIVHDTVEKTFLFVGKVTDPRST